jgi:competence protein ComGC
MSNVSKAESLQGTLMRFAQTLINSIIIFSLLIIIGVLLSLFIPALAESMNREEAIKRNDEYEKLRQQFSKEEEL